MIYERITMFSELARTKEEALTAYFKTLAPTFN
jgi:hypothetical protein